MVAISGITGRKVEVDVEVEGPQQGSDREEVTREEGSICSGKGCSASDWRRSSSTWTSGT